MAKVLGTNSPFRNAISPLTAQFPVEVTMRILQILMRRSKVLVEHFMAVASGIVPKPRLIFWVWGGSLFIWRFFHFLFAIV
jgi:hypothetical protein